MIRIARIPGTLPDALSPLVEQANIEGVHNLDLLTRDWEAHAERFVADGAGLFAAYRGRDIVGVGGVTRQSDLQRPAMRMRRFYVSADIRGNGVARALATSAIRHARQTSRLLTVNARASAMAAPFWESMGFHKVDAETVTHIRWCEGGELDD